MIGLILIVFLVVYLVATIFVTGKVAGWARANNKRAWLWGGLAAFIMYNLVFWDVIPSLLIHKYQCDTKAGFTVYKTPDEWRKENPGQDKGLVERAGVRLTRTGEKGNYKDVYVLNERFNMVVKDKPVISLLPVYERSDEIVDASNGEVMNRFLGFSAAYTDVHSINNLKIWMNLKRCQTEADMRLNLKAYSDFANIGKGNKNND